MITVTNLRKIFTEQGIKGAGKWKREDFTSTIIAAEFAAYAEAETRKPVEVAAEAPAAPGKGKCIVCGIRNGMSAATRRSQGLSKDFSDQCLPCYEEGGWENSHSDAGHDDLNLAKLTEEQAAEVHGCWICYPELNQAKRPARQGQSRAGMVIVAKGTEIHKSLLFKKEAEAIGWTVEISKETYEMAADAEGEGTRHYATATRGADSISLAWDGRAYDYSASSARIAGKDRKVRNLKEALRLI
jgi:hypothetical protein